MNCNANTNAGSACSQQCCCQRLPIHGNHRMCGPSTSVTPPCCWHLPQGYGMPQAANFPYGAYPVGYPSSILGNIHYGPPHVMLNPTGTYPMYSNMGYNQQAYCCNAKAGQRISCCTGRPPMVIPSNPNCNGYCCNDVGAQLEVDKETVEMQKHMTNLWAEVQSVKKPTGSNVGIQVNALDLSVSDHNVNAWDSDADDLDENGGEDNNGDDWGQEDGEETRNPEYDENHHAWDSEEEPTVNNAKVNDWEKEEDSNCYGKERDNSAHSEVYDAQYDVHLHAWDSDVEDVERNVEVNENDGAQDCPESSNVAVLATNETDVGEGEALYQKATLVERLTSFDLISVRPSLKKESESSQPSTSRPSKPPRQKILLDIPTFRTMLEEFHAKCRQG